MLIIKPVQDKALQKELCERCCVEYREESLCYQAHDEDVFVGICQFDMGQIGYIYDLCNPSGVDDEEALFIMGRQTMNFMDLCGTHEAVFSPQSPTSEHLIKWLGFRMKEDRWYMDLHGVFDKHAHRHD